MNIWDLEYLKYKNIPSTITFKPSSSLRNFLNNYKFQGGKVLDIGCGNGRNTIYCLNNGFDYGVGIDISKEAIKIANKFSIKNRYSNRVKYYTHNLNSQLPEENNSFNLILDMTTSHLLNEKQYKNYLNELTRLISYNGYILIYTILENYIDDKLEKNVYINQYNYIKYYFHDIYQDLLNIKRFKIIEKEIYKANKIINNILYQRKYIRLIIQAIL